MIKIDSYIPQFQIKINNLLSEKLEVIGAQSVTWAQDELNAKVYSAWTADKGYELTENLLNSVSYVTDKEASANNKLEAPNYPAVRIGSNVEYALRIEFGFNGQDSLGRTYNQAAKPFLRPILDHKDEINKIMAVRND